jgi:uncharacterized membrane protein YphA (DoxX/SURF4 family)
MKWLATSAPGATMWIRIAAAIVFVNEGVLKVIDPAKYGAGRFAAIGIPLPEVAGPFVTGVELAGGALLLVGLATRFAAVALAIDMIVALASTKLPILREHGVLAAIHEARTDVAMLCATIYLAIVGAGARSLDAMITSRPCRDRTSTSSTSRS